MSEERHTVVALGVYRHVAESMVPLFAKSPFQTAAILDLKQEPESVRYNPHNMATILYSLHPRPKIFITGAAISREMTVESISVWDEYVEMTKQEDTLVINVSVWGWAQTVYAN